MTVSWPQPRSERRSRWLLILLLAFVTTTEVCFAQDGERNEDGTERGPNSKLAKKVEVYLPGALGGLLLLAVLVYCCCKARSASARIDQEEDGADDDTEPAIEGMQLQKTMNRDSKRFNSSRTLAASTSPTERISRPAVMSWDKQSSASTSVASTSSRDDVVPARGQRQARSTARSGSRGGHHAPIAARPASRLPSGGQERTTPGADGHGRSRRARQQHEFAHQPEHQ